MLEVTDLSVSYRGIKAVRGVSLQVTGSGITSIIGRNGAGKSSLVGAIAGIVRPAGGSVVIDGQNISRASAARRCRAGVSLVPESRRIFGALSAIENVMLGADRATKRSGELLESVLTVFPAIKTFSGRAGHQLSGGEQQMVAIARALMCQPKVLILDEPSLGLAPIVVKSVFSAIVELSQRGQSILLIEQNALAALEISQQAYAMSRGELEVLDHRAAAFDPQKLQELYL